MAKRRTHQEQVADVARRRLELLTAELAAARAEAKAAPGDPTAAEEPQGTGPPPPDEAASPPALPGRHARRGLSPADRTAGWLHDRLPPTLQGRVALGPSQLSVVAMLVAVAAVATAWWVVRAVPVEQVTTAAASSEPTPTMLVTPATGPATGEAGGAATTPTADQGDGVPDPSDGSGTSAMIVVDVAGKVRRPGIVVLPVGSRVHDAIEAAGGFRRGVARSSVNLARVLMDGEQVLVGVAAPGGVAAPAAAAPGGANETLVNLNTADQPALESLPGVGPVTAAAILEWRSRNGRFSAVDELLEVSGIGPATLEKLAPRVTL